MVDLPSFLFGDTGPVELSCTKLTSPPQMEKARLIFTTSKAEPLTPPRRLELKSKTKMAFIRHYKPLDFDATAHIVSPAPRHQTEQHR